MPAWLAVMVVFPAPTMVTVVPLTVATAGLELAKATGRPEVAVALMAKGPSPICLVGSGAKVMLWGALAILMVTLAVAAP